MLDDNGLGAQRFCTLAAELHVSFTISSNIEDTRLSLQRSPSMISLFHRYDIKHFISKQMFCRHFHPAQAIVINSVCQYLESTGKNPTCTKFVLWTIIDVAAFDTRALCRQGLWWPRPSWLCLPITLAFLKPPSKPSDNSFANTTRTVTKFMNAPLVSLSAVLCRWKPSVQSTSTFASMSNKSIGCF